MGYQQTSARVSLLRVEIENETSLGNFWESRMRIRVLGGKSESRQWEWESWGKKENWDLVWDSWILKNMGRIKTESVL